MAPYDTLQTFITRYRDIAFLVDFDGTMVDLAPDPDDIRVPTGLLDDLRRIATKPDCAFAVVTGRAVGKLGDFIGNIPLTVVGSHGAEIKTGGDTRPLAAPMPLGDRTAIHAVADRHGCLFEDKAYSLSVHLPLACADEDLKPAFATALANSPIAYVIRKAGRTYEILQSGLSKGSGIMRLMTQTPFAGRTPVYIGDDTHSDDSLNIIKTVGGTLIPVRHQHTPAAQQGADWLEVEDVRHALTALAGAEH
ncbi:MAG: trehalose-phosphatase [Alphaproteobacteria bacterium]|nr:trehalose-phosphatase [Alphaproteobacteria bacterium]